MLGSNCCSEPVSYAAVDEDGTSGLVIELFDDLDALMLYFFMVAHKAACQTLSNAFLKSMKTWWKSCWCWRYFSHRMRRLKNFSVVLLYCSGACLFFGDDVLRLWLQSVQYDLQHDFVWVIDKAYCSVVLALLQVAFLGKCDD